MEQNGRRPETSGEISVPLGGGWYPAGSDLQFSASPTLVPGTAVLTADGADIERIGRPGHVSPCIGMRVESGDAVRVVVRERAGLAFRVLVSTVDRRLYLRPIC